MPTCVIYTEKHPDKNAMRTAHSTGHAARPALATTLVGAPEQEEEARKRNEREEQVAEERRQAALLLALGNGDVDAVLGEDVDQLWVVGQRHLQADEVEDMILLTACAQAVRRLCK